MPGHRPIIIIRKKGGHGGHHGGAWKVAYADFVTAMMALFIVLWLMNSSKQIQEAVGGYFKDPTGTSKKIGSGLVGSGDNFAVSKDNMQELKEELQKAIRRVDNFDKLSQQIEMTVTNEGLRVELLESEVGTFFETGSVEPNQSGREMLKMLASELGKLPNKVSIEGHTDSMGSDVANQKISEKRAQNVKKYLQDKFNISDDRMMVKGYGKTKPIADNNTKEGRAKNRRVEFRIVP